MTDVPESLRGRQVPVSASMDARCRRDRRAGVHTSGHLQTSTSDPTLESPEPPSWLQAKSKASKSEKQSEVASEKASKSELPSASIPDVWRRVILLQARKHHTRYFVSLSSRGDCGGSSHSLPPALPCFHPFCGINTAGEFVRSRLSNFSAAQSRARERISQQGKQLLNFC
jgi:hypothetical protein